MINNIVTEVFDFNIYAYYLSTNRGTVVVYIAQTVSVLHLVSTMQFPAVMLQSDRLDWFYFYFDIDNLPSRFCFFNCQENSHLLFHPLFSLILFIFLVF